MPQNTIFEAQKHDFLGPGGHDRVFVSMVAAPLVQAWDPRPQRPRTANFCPHAVLVPVSITDQFYVSISNGSAVAVLNIKQMLTYRQADRTEFIPSTAVVGGNKLNFLSF